MKAFFCLLLLLAMPLAHAGAEPVQSVLEDFRLHGFVSPLKAMERLQAVSDAPGANAPLALRRRYHAALARFASQANHEDVARASLKALDRMASMEGCRRCGADALLVRAQAALNRRDYKQARDDLAAAGRLVDDHDPQLQVSLHLAQARFHDLRGELAQGIAEAVRAQALAERLGNVADQAMAMNSMIGMNADLGDYARAQTLAHEAYAIAERNGFAYLMAHVRAEQGYLYSRWGKPEAQRQALLDALRICGDDPSLSEVRLITLANLSDYFLSAHQPHQALEYARRAETVARAAGDDNGRTVALANMGIAASELGEHERGIAWLLQAIGLGEKIGATSYVIQSNAELVNAYERAGRLHEALAAMRRVDSLNQELTRQERDKAVLELQERYSAERKSREIERLSDANRLQQAEMAARSWQQRLWATLAVVLLLTAVGLGRRLHRAWRANRRLSGDIAVLSEQSLHDPLTGISNRRHCGLLMEQHAQSGASVGLVMLDVDYFKRINDGFGHAAGDRVLIELAYRLRGLVREQDAVVRWGGEEFLLLLPDVTATALSALAGRVLQAIGATPVEVGHWRIKVTASLGAAIHPLAAGADWEAVVQLVDVALYLSKAGGRNRGTCVTRIRDGANLAAIHNDLAAAGSAGEVDLQVVEGPRPSKRAVVIPFPAAAE